MLVLVQGGSLPHVVAIGAGVGGVACLAALLLHEARTREPMLPLELWRDRVIVIGSLGGGLAGAVMMGVSAFLPSYVQGALGGTPLTGGARAGCHVGDLGVRQHLRRPPDGPHQLSHERGAGRVVAACGQRWCW